MTDDEKLIDLMVRKVTELMESEKIAEALSLLYDPDFANILQTTDPKNSEAILYNSVCKFVIRMESPKDLSEYNERYFLLLKYEEIVNFLRFFKCKETIEIGWRLLGSYKHEHDDFTKIY